MLTIILSFLLFNSFLFFILWIYSKLFIGICKSSKHLVGKVVIITGGNAGIGFETAKDLADRGAKVILACRNEQRGQDARKAIIEETGNQDVHCKQLNLGSLKSVRDFAENILKSEKRLDILINNAGCYELKKEKTEDGLLKTMQVNHFGHFLLTNLLLPLLKVSGPSRVITVSSGGHFRANIDIKDLNLDADKDYSAMKAYANSKLCNILMTTELSRQLEGTEVTTNCLHPGVIATDLFHNISDSFIFKYAVQIFKHFFKSSWEGAQTTIYLAVSPDVCNVSGKYFTDCKIGKMSAAAQDEDLASKLWKESEKIVGLAK